MAAAVVAPKAFAAGFFVFVLFLLVVTTQFRFKFPGIASQVTQRINHRTCSRAREFSKAKQNRHKNLSPCRARELDTGKAAGEGGRRFTSGGRARRPKRTPGISPGPRGGFRLESAGELVVSRRVSAGEPNEGRRGAGQPGRDERAFLERPLRYHPHTAHTLTTQKTTSPPTHPRAGGKKNPCRNQRGARERTRTSTPCGTRS